MMTGAAALAMVRGLPWAKLLPILVLLAALAALLVVRGQRDDAVTEGTQAKAEAQTNGRSVKVLEQARASDDKAADARQADTKRIADEANQLKETNRALPDQPLSDRARARLERVRQQQGDDGRARRVDPASRRPG